MSRDHTKLRVFSLAEQLAVELYQSTASFPATERFGLQGQMRRAAVSVVANIVEGSARRTERDYVHFLNVATGSAAETVCLIRLAIRIGYLEDRGSVALETRYTDLVRGLKKLVDTLESHSASG